jgi:hypothetical protein
MRLVLLLSILAAALQADPVTVIATRSEFGTASLFYSFDVPAFPGPVTAQISGGTNCLGGIPQCGDQYATARIDLTMDLYTSGPTRDGIGLVQLFLGGDGSGGGATHVSGAIGPYSLGFCAKGLTCLLYGYFPFELGVPFTIDLSGFANANPQFFGDAGFSAYASLQLYELPTQVGDRAGAPVQINLVPEPGSAGLAFTGLSAVIFFAVRRRRNLPSI